MNVALRFVCLAAVFLTAGAISAQTLEVTATDPAGGGRLPPNRTFYLKVHYDSPQPLRLKATGMLGGKKVQDITNPSPVYPAGTGDGLVWISYRTSTRIDAVQVSASDQNWRPISSLTFPVEVSWASSASDPAEAGWVREMNETQQREISSALQSSQGNPGILGWAFFAFLYVSVLGYPVLQIHSLCRDGWKSAASLPLFLMIPLMVYTAWALAMGSNLWPLLLLFGSPFACLYLVALRIWRWGKRNPGLRVS